MKRFFQKYQRENRLNMTRNEEARRKKGATTAANSGRFSHGSCL
jgi:hypothetical protein